MTSTRITRLFVVATISLLCAAVSACTVDADDESIGEAESYISPSASPPAACADTLAPA